MDAFSLRTLEIIENTVKLDTLPITEQLQEINYPLNVLRLCCHNWRAENLRKIYFMRLTVRCRNFSISEWPFTQRRILTCLSSISTFLIHEKKQLPILISSPYSAVIPTTENILNSSSQSMKSSVIFPKLGHETG